MLRRFIAVAVPLVVLAAVIPVHANAASISQAQRHASIAMRTYIDPQFAYTVRYPASWNIIKGLPSAQLFGPHLGQLAPTTLLIGSLDMKAAVFIMAGHGKYTAAAIKEIEKELLLQDVTPRGKLVYGALTINGVVFQEASLVAISSGEMESEAVYSVVRGNDHYFIGTAVIPGLPATNSERSLVRAIRDSIHLH